MLLDTEIYKLQVRVPYLQKKPDKSNPKEHFARKKAQKIPQNQK